MYVVEDVTHRQLTLKKLYLHWETSLIFALNVFTLLSSSTNKRIIPELFVLKLQIDVDCTSYFDTEVFQHVRLVDSDAWRHGAPDDAGKLTIGSSPWVFHCYFVDDCQNAETWILYSENEE